LLGPNGAGKSSPMRISATVTRPTSGRLLFDGTNAGPGVLRGNLAYLPQDFGVYPHLSAREFLSYLAAVKGLPSRAAWRRIGELLGLLDLAGVGKPSLGTYSGGMLRRVGIAQALLTDPKLLIVDEPTAGLDPGQRVVFRNLLADLAGDRVVLLSTHIVCRRIARRHRDHGGSPAAAARQPPGPAAPGGRAGLGGYRPARRTSRSPRPAPGQQDGPHRGQSTGPVAGTDRAGPRTRPRSCRTLRTPTS
jgi:ABC-type lipoprotein export system ATPase subunit